MKRPCHACGRVVPAGITTGGAFICHSCEVDVQEKITRLRLHGKMVNVRHVAKALLRERHSEQGRWVLEDPPAELWKLVKNHADQYNINMRDVVLTAVDEYLKKWGSIG